MQDRYIFAGEGGDQLTGRCASGLPFHDIRFAALPPHLHPEAAASLTMDDWNTILPGYSSYPEGFKSAVPFFFASLVAHSDFLMTSLPPTHPIRTAPVFSQGYVDRFKDNILLGNARCEVTGMQASGVPQSTSLLHSVQALQAEIQMLKNKQSQDKDAIIAAVNTLPQAVTSEILQRVQIDGAHPLTREEVQNMLSTFTSQIIQRVDAIVGGSGPAPAVMMSTQHPLRFVLGFGHTQTTTASRSIIPAPSHFVSPQLP